MKKIAIASVAALSGSPMTIAQSVGSAELANNQALIKELQTEKRQVMLDTLKLTPEQSAKFTPIYDEYQAEMKGQFQRGVDVLNKFAANYGSMTDDAAQDIMKEWFSLRDNRNALMKKYAKQFGKKLPATDVLRWVQIENKLNTLLDMQAARVIPIATK
jgi:Spy/CpxP family protein refolding chaperone